MRRPVRRRSERSVSSRRRPAPPCPMPMPHVPLRSRRCCPRKWSGRTCSKSSAARPKRCSTRTPAALPSRPSRIWSSPAPPTGWRSSRPSPRRPPARPVTSAASDDAVLGAALESALSGIQPLFRRLEDNLVLMDQALRLRVSHGVLTAAQADAVLREWATALALKDLSRGPDPEVVAMYRTEASGFLSSVQKAIPTVTKWPADWPATHTASATGTSGLSATPSWRFRPRLRAHHRTGGGADCVVVDAGQRDVLRPAICLPTNMTGCSTPSPRQCRRCRA